MSTLIELRPNPVRMPPQVDPVLRPAAPRADGAELQLMALWALERLDQGILLLAPNAAVRFANRCARDLVAESAVLEMSCGLLQATAEPDRSRLRDGLHAASTRGHVRMLRLGCGAQAQYLTLSGIGPPGIAGPVLALLGRQTLCNPLALQWFAQCHELTTAESKVLRQLCEGLEPSEIAARQGVALSTVRSQIGAIRTKTGQDSIRALLNVLGRLPLYRAMLLGWCAAGT